MKPANPKARVLHAKLSALAERGVNGEQASAIRKLAKLEARFDFSAPAERAECDLFNGVFQRGTAAESLGRFPQRDIAAAVKWALESATRIPCLFRGDELLAQATPKTAQKLSVIAGTVAESFGQLWAQFVKVPGVNGAERALFMRALFDGMMGDEKKEGEPLPKRVVVKLRRGAKVRAVALATHPYTLGVRLGRAVRFSVPLPELAKQLERAVAGSLEAGKAMP